MAPEPEERTSGELLEELGRLASSYTPEWRLNLERPDMGTALARLFAACMEDTACDYSRTPELYYDGFIRCVGWEPREAGRAEGYLTFGLAKKDMPEICLPAGWGIVSSGEGGSVAMETKEDVYVSSASVTMEEDGGSWILVFDRPVNEGIISLLFLMKQWEAPGDKRLIWEYYGSRGWTPLSVEDGTGRFSRGGIIRFAATSDFREYEEGGRHPAGVRGWRVRVTGDPPGCLPAARPEVYMNGALAAALDGGERGNLKPGAKHRLKRTAGFVTAIRNPDYFFGGSPKESFEEGAARARARLRHQMRAVTPGDYERLALEVCHNAVKVQCFPGYEESGGKKWGAVTLVILCRDFMEGQPGFYKMKEQLLEFFEDKTGEALAAGGEFYITYPRFIYMDVKAVVCVRDMSAVMEVRERGRRELARFLNPVSGGYDGSGWDMGMIPGRMHIKNCLQRVPGTYYIRQFSARRRLEGNGGREEDWESAAEFPWALPLPGECTLDVEMG